MKLKDCDSCLVYGTDNKPLSKARVEIGSEKGIRMFFQNRKLRSVRIKTIVDFYDRSNGVVRSRCELVIQRNDKSGKINEPWMAVCDILEIYEVYQRQKDLRIEVNLHTEFKTEKGWYFLGKILNISAGGIFLVTPQVLKRNERFTFKHNFGREEYEIGARVLRAAGLVEGDFGYGCQFVGISSDAEAAIRKFVFTQQVKKQNSKGRG
ncbi:PilZ domain-containing protein [Clostridiaceae bacterium]|nr:PilZ domain-containing protein [Clostridiaceae bacterium]RKI11644.1 PilZ domain-containing protein [bacterium 1XD21-70]